MHRTAAGVGAVLLLLSLDALAGAGAVTNGAAWWAWPLALFLLSLVMGIVAVLAGVGGGVLFVPIVGGLFPFHLDFVRSTGLLLALAGALSAGPSLLANGLASLRLALPFALVGSIFSVVGALISFAIPDSIMQLMLGVTILFIAALMVHTGTDTIAAVRIDALAAMLGLRGAYYDPALGREVHWQAQRAGVGLVVFAAIGLVGGLFGLGAGWANVPALNLLIGLPVKGAVATSTIVMSIVNSSAAWIYIERGAVLAIITVPAIAGVMIGAGLGARLLKHLPAAVLKRIVITILVLAGLRALSRGMGWWA